MLKFIALSGTTDVTENLYVYESGDSMVILDCGIGFPDLEAPGVELVLPDFSYIVKNKHKLKGIVLSQGHDDHIGGIPFLFRDVKAPIYCAPIVTEFLKLKFEDYKIKDYKINTFNPDHDTFSIGPFKFHPFRVTHSVPDTVGYAIDTPEGRFFHVAEHKIDQESTDNMSFDIQKAKRLAQEKKPICLMSDCLGANHEGYGKSGQSIEENIFKIASHARGALFVTAISSGIGRFQQIMNVARRVGRKVVFVGRSIQQKIEIAHDLGYIKYLPDQVVDSKKIKGVKPEKTMYLIAGCYGQAGSSVYRVTLGEHDRVSIKEGDTFIFSADPGPAYSKESQDLIVDKLIDKGVDVHYYDLHEGLHVSGHGGKDDILDLFRIVNPRYFIPTGGTIRFMKSYEDLAVKFGAPRNNVFRLKPGESVIFNNGQIKRGEPIRIREIFVHGLGVGDIGKVVLEDRNKLRDQGFVVATIKFEKGFRQIRGPIEMTSRGFVFEQIYGRILDEASQKLTKYLRNKKVGNIDNAKSMIIDYLEKYFYTQTRRSPMIIPVVVEI